MTVHANHRDRVLVVTIDRLERRNAVDAATAVELIELARDLSALPQPGIRHDRLAVLEQWGLNETDAITNEIRHAALIADTVDFATVVDQSQG